MERLTLHAASPTKGKPADGHKLSMIDCVSSLKESKPDGLFLDPSLAYGSHGDWIYHTDEGSDRTGWDGMSTWQVIPSRQ